MRKYKYEKEWRRNHPEDVREAYQKYYQSHKEQKRIYMKNYRHRLHLKVIEALGNKCIRCGETDWRCLQIDHVKGDGAKVNRKKNRRMSTTIYYLRITREVLSGSKDYQLLCANCNWRKKYENNENSNGYNKNSRN